LPAAVFIVLHLSPHSPSRLPQILSKAGPMPAAWPVDSEQITPGRIYVAPPDLHLVIEDEHVRTIHGPKENRCRPAVDVLFRSAAYAHGPSVAGVVLTGSLDDGTAGLQAIKKSGGVAVVQDPHDACFPGMPDSARRYVEVDYCLPLSKIAPVLVQLARDPVASADHERKAKIMAEQANGAFISLTCPECNGNLVAENMGKLCQFYCPAGHRFSPESLLAEKSAAIERALWVSFNLMKQRSALVAAISPGTQSRGDSGRGDFDQMMKIETERAEQIRQMIDNEAIPDFF
jgi:two-component system chemotaxis response regulator CheB